MKMLARAAAILLVAGGINWGSVGLFDVNIIEYVFPAWTPRLLFVLIGAAAAYKIAIWEQLMNAHKHR